MHDLRSFLQLLQSHGDLLRVSDPVSTELESTALCRRAMREQGPALLFEHAGESRLPLLGNLFGHRRRIEWALGSRPLNSLRELGQLFASLKKPRWPGSLREALGNWPGLAQLAHVAPRHLDRAPFQCDCREGPDVDLGLLPIQRCWPGDVAPLISLGLVITRSTRQPRQNLAIYRQQVIGPNRLILRWLPHRGGAQDHADWCQRHPQRPFPVMVAIGADPATLLAAVAPIPDTLSEFEFAGLLRGERSQVWQSGLTGLDAPAGSEILLEGVVHPGDQALDGPFGDHHAQGMFPVMTVSRMQMRSDAIYHGSSMGRPSEDELSVLALALNELFVPILQRASPEIVDLHLPLEACSSSPNAQLGSRLGIDATRKLAAERSRNCLPEIAPDNAVEARMEQLWQRLRFTEAAAGDGR